MTGLTDVAALILAAGLSSRMGSPKPLLPWGDKTIIEHIIATLHTAGMTTIYGVTGHAADQIAPLVIKLNARVVHNNDYAKFDLTSSLKVGLRALPAESQAVLVCLTDQPLLLPQTIMTLITTWRASRAAIVAPTYRGQRGHPVLFSRSMWPELLGLADTDMPRTVLHRHADSVQYLAVEDAGIVIDIDTPDDYQRLRK